jgi:putative redox protein
MVEIQIAYEGQLHCGATHVQSGTKIATDAPKDNHGLGQSFSPTDLLATSLGTCMMTIMGIVGNKNGIDLTGTKVRVLKEMTPQPPRKVAKLTVELTIPHHVDADKRPMLENAAHTCPVRLSIHPDIEVPVTFKWGL